MVDINLDEATNIPLNLASDPGGTAIVQFLSVSGITFNGPDYLEFNSGNWNTPQNLNVTGTVEGSYNINYEVRCNWSPEWNFREGSVPVTVVEGSTDLFQQFLDSLNEADPQGFVSLSVNPTSGDMQAFYCEYSNASFSVSQDGSESWLYSFNESTDYFQGDLYTDGGPSQFINIMMQVNAGPEIEAGVYSEAVQYRRLSDSKLFRITNSSFNTTKVYTNTAELEADLGEMSGTNRILYIVFTDVEFTEDGGSETFVADIEVGFNYYVNDPT